MNPLTSPGEGFTVFTSPYLSAEAPALGEAKGLYNFQILIKNKITVININPLTLPGEVVTTFTYPYLSAGAPELGEVKGLILDSIFNLFRDYIKNKFNS